MAKMRRESNSSRGWSGLSTLQPVGQQRQSTKGLSLCVTIWLPVRFAIHEMKAPVQPLSRPGGTIPWMLQFPSPKALGH